MLEIGTQLFVTILGLFLVLGLVIVIHELGHYWAGRLVGAKIESFSVGFGKSLIEFSDRRGTRWRINRLPFGGFVGFVSRGQIARGAVREGIIGKPYEDIGPWKRNFISVAGPFANFVLAIALYASLSIWNGVITADTFISKVQDDSPAAQAGLEVGDQIISVDGRKLRNSEYLLQSIALSANSPLSLGIQRANQTLSLDVVPIAEERENALGQSAKMGVIGAELRNANMTRTRPGMMGALDFGINKTYEIITATGQVLTRIVTGRDSIHMMTGPVGIGDATRRVYVVATGENSATTSQRIRWAIMVMIQLIAAISIGVGFLNLLPLPILDGGHIVINTYEAITGSMMPEIVQEYAMRLGLLGLIGLFVFISLGDLWEIGLIG